MKIILASRNKKKIREMEAILARHVEGVQLLSLDDIGFEGDIEEDGTTFEVSTDDMDIEIMGIKDHKIEKAVVTFKEKSEEQEEAPAEE